MTHQPQPGRSDYEKVANGLIPWNAEEYFEVHEYSFGLEHTPRDDWPSPVDRGMGGLVFLGDNEREDFVRALSLKGQQLYRLLLQRHKDPVVAAAHMYRAGEIGWFLKTYYGRLVSAGLITPTSYVDPVSGPASNILPPLIQALCELSYSAHRQRDGRYVPCFNFNDVLRRALQLLAEGGAGPAAGP
jgi:hypothetical protein